MIDTPVQRMFRRELQIVNSLACTIKKICNKNKVKRLSTLGRIEEFGERAHEKGWRKKQEWRK